MANIRAKKVILKNRDGEHLVPITDVDALNYKNITNCLLEVPQRINLELTDSGLTLKAGSVVIVPNGADGFKEVVISADLTMALTTFTGSEQFMLFYNETGGLAGRRLASQVASGTTTPTTGHWDYYNTTNNYVYVIVNGEIRDYRASFPLGLITVTDGTITSIDQVFNGMGYIGSTYWIDKGVKGLVPNGRNADGSLNNIEFTTPKLATATLSAYTNNNMPFQYNASTNTAGWSDWLYVQEEKPNDNYSHWYKPSENVLYYAGSTTGDYQPIKDLICGFLGRTGGVVTEWQPKQPIHAADIQDVVRKTGDTMSGALNFNGVSGAKHIIMTTNESDIVNVRTHQTDFDFTTTTAPSKSKYLQRFLVYDKNNNYVSTFETMHSTSNNIFTNINTRRSVGGSVKTASISIGVDSSGKAYATAPASSITNSIVTQAGLSKATNGYCKFGNGMILQWGVHSSGSGGGEYTITLPTAFSNTNYSVVGVSRGDKVSNSDYQVHFKITSKTQFKKTGQVATGVYWFAIGY